LLKNPLRVLLREGQRPYPLRRLGTITSTPFGVTRIRHRVAPADMRTENEIALPQSSTVRVCAFRVAVIPSHTPYRAHRPLPREAGARPLPPDTNPIAQNPAPTIPPEGFGLLCSCRPESPTSRGADAAHESPREGGVCLSDLAHPGLLTGSPDKSSFIMPYSANPQRLDDSNSPTRTGSGTFEDRCNSYSEDRSCD
jgi:hypothetical protein